MLFSSSFAAHDDGTNFEVLWQSCLFKILLLIMRVVCALCLSLILILSEFFRSLGFPAFCVCFYEVFNVPSSYRQPGGRGQSFSRRYCTHSVWLFSCAQRTAQWFHGALAVSCKYFKQSKWPFLAAYQHAYSSYLSYLRSTRYSSMWR